MFRRSVFFLLVMLLLPACTGLPVFPPPTSGPRVQKADETLFQEAEASYRRQAYRQALEGYTAYLARYPQGKQAAAARLREAELLGLVGDWQGSLRRYQALLARHPQPEDALKIRYGIGRAYFKVGQYQQATQVLDSLTAGDLPRSLWFSTQALLAEIALKQGLITQAFSRLRLAAQDLGAGDQEWFEDLKTRVVEQASTQELEHLATLYRDSPLSAAILLRLARRAQEAGQAQEAEKWASILQERFPTSPEAATAVSLRGRGPALLGCLLPLSGELGNIGFRVQRGMELALRQAPMELAFRDTHSDPTAAARLIRDLVQDERLLAIVGPLTSGVAQTAAEAAQASGVPLIALSQKAGLTQVGNLVFQAFLTPRQQVQTLVRRTLGRGLKRYAVLYPDSTYGRTFLQIFQEELASQGGELTLQEPYAPGTQDFGPVLASLREHLKTLAPGAAAPEALFVPDDAAAVAAIAGQLTGGSWRVQLLGTNLLHQPRIAADHLQALEGALFPDAFFAADPHPEVQKFVAAYQERYGEEPDYLAAQGYVALRLLARLMESGKPLTRADLPGQLLALKPVPELPWFQGFNAQREEEAALYLLTIKGGRVQMMP